MEVNGFIKKTRLWIFSVACVLFLICIYAKYARLAVSPQRQRLPPAATVERGSIVDRNGKPLAVQTRFFHFGVSPKMIENPERFANIVSPIIDMSAQDIAQRINDNKTREFIYIKKKLTQQTRDELFAAISAAGYRNFCTLDSIPGRVYPMGDLASQLIGFMGDDGLGLSGMEYSQQDILSPKPKEGETGTLYGQNIYLTIDANLQYKLEKIAKDTMQETQAESLMMLASDVRTGEILSYISLPEANLNTYTEALPTQLIDRPAAKIYEPGSVFKIFTAASYLDSGVISRGTTFICDGAYRTTTNLGEHIVIDCMAHHGTVDVRKALELSCNDAFGQMSDFMTEEMLLSYIHSFGFGKKTGAELSLEEVGIVRSPDSPEWSARTKPTMSIGQEISVTALQMIHAASIIANEGVPVKPSLIRRVVDKTGAHTYEHTPEYEARVIKSSVAQYILDCMETTTIRGNGQKAGIKDITLGTKTGTAQIAGPRGYSDTDFLASCISIFPVEEPQIILYLVIEKPQGEYLGGRIAAPVIRKAADEIVNHLGITREGAASVTHSGHISIPESEPLVLGSLVPDFTDRPLSDIVPLLEQRPDITFEIQGHGYVQRQIPEPGTVCTEGMTIELYLE